MHYKLCLSKAVGLLKDEFDEKMEKNANAANRKKKLAYRNGFAKESPANCYKIKILLKSKP